MGLMGLMGTKGCSGCSRGPDFHICVKCLREKVMPDMEWQHLALTEVERILNKLTVVDGG